MAEFRIELNLLNPRPLPLTTETTHHSGKDLAHRLDRALIPSAASANGEHQNMTRTSISFLDTENEAGKAWEEKQGE